MSNLPINMRAYAKFIAVSNISENDFFKILMDFSEIYTDARDSHEFRYFFDIHEDKSYLYIKCPPNISFFNFHNLLMTFNEFYGIGFMFHSENSNLSYYCKPAKTPYGDTLTGKFSDGRVLSVYLPEAFSEKGNLIITGSSNDLSFHDMLEEYDKNKIIDSFEFRQYDHLSVDI